jgi:hypothetical protein
MEDIARANSKKQKILNVLVKSLENKNIRVSAIVVYTIKCDMEFEIFNDKGTRVFYTFQEICIPPKHEIDIMSKNGWKFKLNGKLISKTKLIEIITKR